MAEATSSFKGGELRVDGKLHHHFQVVRLSLNFRLYGAVNPVVKSWHTWEKGWRQNADVVNELSCVTSVESSLHS